MVDKNDYSSQVVLIRDDSKGLLKIFHNSREIFKL